jgi:glycosyltransferase involved in cell wall biosynthesis
MGSVLRAAPEPLTPAEEPLVSVIIPVYNGEAFLAETLESVLAQSYRRLEVVVADNVSTDGSTGIADEYGRHDPRVKLVRSEQHVGIRASWNRAIALASQESRYIKVLPGDDLLLPGCIAGQAAVAARNPRVTLVGGYRFEGDELGLLGLPLATSVVPGAEIARRALLGGSDLFGSSANALYRADLVRSRSEFFGPPFFYNFDHAVCFDLLGEGDFGFVHEVVSWSRVHAEQNTSRTNRLRQWEPGDLALLARYGPRFLSTAELRRRLSALGGRYSWMLGKQAVKGRPWRDREFRDFHGEALDRIAGELRAGGQRIPAAFARAASRALRLPESASSGRLRPRAASPDI